MSVTLALDIRLWQPGKAERILTASDLLNKHSQLRTDQQLLQAIKIDNLRYCLDIDGAIVSVCTFMFDGKSSPDLLHLYEESLPDLFEGKPVTINFYEEMTAWHLKPADDEMNWEIVDLSRGESQATVERVGRCERLPFINAAIDWLSKAISILERYRDDVEQCSGEDLTPQIEMAQRLLDFSVEKLTKMGWQ